MQLRAPTPDVFHTAKALISEQGVAAVGRPLIARTAVWLAVLLTFGCARGLAGPPFQIDPRDSSRKSGICRRSVPWQCLRFRVLPPRMKG